MTFSGYKSVGGILSFIEDGIIENKKICDFLAIMTYFKKK
jgi:hypothetical protein